MKISDLNDLNLRDLSSIPNYFTQSMWVGDFCALKPSDFGVPSFHGRFHPAIPYAMMSRYTKVGETVWDPFAGGGTTEDVGKLLGRRVISNDLNPVRKGILRADSRLWSPGEKVQLSLLHPPYWDMIKFSEDDSDLSNCRSSGEFAQNFGLVIEQVNKVLEASRFLILIISDVYRNSQQVPLDYYCYDEIIKRGYILKGRIVKDFGETKNSRKKYENLWKYRRLKGGFWELNLDFILVFQKNKN